ncbi:MAG: hypothetical protein WA827_19880, partial [Candidatus Binatus sp.]
MLSRWLRLLVVAPVVLFVFGAILLSCGSGGSGGTLPTPSPGFALEAITISTGAPPSPTPTVFPTPKNSVTPTLTPRPSASPTNIEPGSVPTGGTISFNAIGTFIRNKRIKYVDITA